MLDYFTQPIESYVGYPETASYMAKILGVGVPVNREQAVLEDGDVVLVCKLAHRVQDPTTKGKFTPDQYEWWVVYYNTHKEGQSWERKSK